MRSPVVLVRSSTCPVKNEYGQVRGELQRIISDRVMIKTFFGHSFSACFKFQVSGLILFGCPVRGTEGSTQVQNTEYAEEFCKTKVSVAAGKQYF